MKRIQVIAIFFILLTGGWSSVLAAAFCPHVQARSCCMKRMGAEHQGNHTMAHEGMAMDDMQMPTSAAPNSEAEGKALDQPFEPCAHCAGHSGLPTAPVVLGGTEQARRDAHNLAPPASAPSAPQELSLAPTVPKLQHAPPGAKSSRHALVNVFRI